MEKCENWEEPEETGYSDPLPIFQPGPEAREFEQPPVFERDPENVVNSSKGLLKSLRRKLAADIDGKKYY